MKKKNISGQNYKDWLSYTRNMKDIYDKDKILTKNKFNINKIITIDLHGMSLDDANITVKKFIEDAFEKKINKIKVITGKGLRSKSSITPYISSKFSTLKNSVPEFIKNDTVLVGKIKRIDTAEPEEGGDGAFYILLKTFRG